MKRNKHSLSHYKLLTCDMGKLVPVSCVPVLPGDTLQHRSSALLRVSPLLAPVMHPVVVRLHHWYVPNRIVWPEWEDFITGGPDGQDATQIPTITTNENHGVGQLLDYLGIPQVEGMQINALPVFAFNKIYNEFYRDQDLIDPRSEWAVTLPNIAWEKDYFSSARPWTQKGDEVTLPVGGHAPVRGLGKINTVYNGTNGDVFESGENNANYDTYALMNDVDVNSHFAVQQDSESAGYPNIYAELGEADLISVNDFRMGFALQRYKEARARYGSRYTEYLAYLGVKSSDARLQRPEYLGGGKQTLSFSEVLQTVDDETGQERGPLGKMGGHGIAAMRSNRYRRFFEEHGYVITMMSIRPKTIYSDGIHRDFLKTTKEDYYQKELEHVGQQEVINNEIYADPDNGSNTFGYQDRYAEYRHFPSNVAAEFRNTLNYWHMARSFGSAPVLNQAFVECDATKRIHAEQTAHSMWCMVNHSIQARRLVKKPGMNRVI